VSDIVAPAAPGARVTFVGGHVVSGLSPGIRFGARPQGSSEGKTPQPQGLPPGTQSAWQQHHDASAVIQAIQEQDRNKRTFTAAQAGFRTPLPILGMGAPPEAIVKGALNVDQTKDTGVTAERTTQATLIGVIKTNRVAIVLSIASLEILVDEQLASLRDQRPNEPRAQDARNEAIAHYEKLKLDLETLRGATEQPELGKTDEDIETAATSFAQGIRNWWTKKHEDICDKAYDAAIRGNDAAIFLSCVSVCSLMGCGGPIAVVLSGAIAGRKTVVEALKAFGGGGKK